MAFDPAYADAIASIESGGRYDLLGPETKSGDRAYGKYQVMGNNIGPWTKEILGKELTPDQFLSNPAAQDAVFAGKFSQSLDKYGNPQDAASVWFSGRPLAKAANAKDLLGTTGAAYVAKFNAALGNNGATNSPNFAPQQPQQVAQQPQQAAPQQPIQAPQATPKLPAFNWSPQMTMGGGAPMPQRAPAPMLSMPQAPMPRPIDPRILQALAMQFRRIYPLQG